MIACVLVPGFELRAALRKRPGLALRPAALGPRPGAEPLVGPVTAAAEEAGVRPGMRLGEALSLCPSLHLVEQDPAAVEEEWEALLRRLEGAGFPVEPAEPGCAYVETRAVERLYGGLEPALQRALAVAGAVWDPRVGAASRRFAALAAAGVARAGQVVVVSDEQTPGFLAPLPLDAVPLEEARRRELRELGVRRLGDLASLPAGSVAERLGQDGSDAWRLARGGAKGRVRARRPASELAERLVFPDAVANELTLRRAFAVLVERVLARPEREGRFVRKLALGAKLATGGSWRRSSTLREPAAEAERLRLVLGPKLAELPAPVLELCVELVELSRSTGDQLELLKAAGDDRRVRLGEGLRQVRASTGSGSVCSVVEVAPWSRIPETRALLVPRDE